MGRLEATMARLDAEAAAVVRLSQAPTAAEARTYLAKLPNLWARTSDAGRHAIAEATFERIDVLGVTNYSFTGPRSLRPRGDWRALPRTGFDGGSEQLGQTESRTNDTGLRGASDAPPWQGGPM